MTLPGMVLRRARKALFKVLYHHPKGGMLPTLIHTRHPNPPPKPTWRECREVGVIAERLRQIHQQAFRQACIDVTGEDPETDWDMAV